MEYKQFSVEGLFGLYDHSIDFSTSKTPDKRASIIMLYGKNGVGKTTVLRMIEGFMNLDFTVFREVSFNKAHLSFSNGETIKVEGVYDEQKVLQHLKVSYKKAEIKLHAEKTGVADEENHKKQEIITSLYRKDLDNFSFTFIDTERLMKKNLKEEIALERFQGKLPGKKSQKDPTILAEMIQIFITQSQVYSARFFNKDEPELFEKILLNIENPTKITIEDLTKRISAIAKAEKDFQLKRLGIALEVWDKKKLIKILTEENKKKGPNSIHKLTVINSYLEVLESKYNEKTSLAERLLVFEDLLNNFLLDKNVTVSSNTGLEIKSIKGDTLQETQLSTGEYHLLYLTSLALCTTVKGTVIAIDEPEMSMHVSWQNKLIKALLKISSKANPQFIFATHSPDIAANHFNSLKTGAYGKN